MNEQIESFAEDKTAYDGFVDKFKAKPTTDDCYTPPLVMEAVNRWVEERYGVDRENFVRPFWPGGDYEAFDYRPGAVVVDNPPFSIFSKITRFYCDKGISFFLFGPALTLFSADERCTVLPVGVQIVYENGAAVATSFVTNLEPEDIRLAVRPDLYAMVEAAAKTAAAMKKKKVARLSFPDDVITAAIAQKYSHYGCNLEVRRDECVFVRKIDNYEGGLFGGGFLLSRAAAERAAAERAASERAAAERAAAERAAAERAAAATRLELSWREKRLQASLDGIELPEDPAQITIGGIG